MGQFSMEISGHAGSVLSGNQHMILQQAIVLGLIGFVVGKITATFAAPLFPKFVLLLSADTIIGVIVVIAICALASIVAIRMALKVDPAEAIGG